MSDHVVQPDISAHVEVEMKESGRARAGTDVTSSPNPLAKNDQTVIDVEQPDGGVIQRRAGRESPRW